MATPFDVTPRNDRELVLGRVLDCSPTSAFRCWSEPDLITRWFTPPPWKTVSAELDLRAGGVNTITMQGPDGAQMPNRGVYLEVISNRRIVFTSAFGEGWAPVETGPHSLLFVGDITFDDADGGKTRYVARAGHWTKEAAAQHEQMGFHTGWGIAADQLEAVARTL